MDVDNFQFKINSSHNCYIHIRRRIDGQSTRSLCYRHLRHAHHKKDKCATDYNMGISRWTLICMMVKLYSWLLNPLAGIECTL